ncbi:nucleoside triphosphate hydrolase [Criibacterium bergeronii]|uniref:Nucleoside triphosphate hydrolase n=1 Tax=Criibacterium bergeronii TaxID=1871336 RepID=A0A552UY56_9FIRM|nr:ATP-binding protein [Criibacterium bergeronii]TRW23153.1 nucleoside triphosphate hydrolase [Criibacterium bergeronii]
MNNKENIITIKIQGTDFTYNKETHYEKDGHIYCKTCNERIDGRSIPMLDKKLMIIRNACKCDRERKEQEELREKQIEQNRLRQNCFISKNQIAYTFDNIDENTDKDIIKKVKNYVKYFEEMRKDNVGLLLYGNVGSGKTYIACSIANAIITEYSYKVKMRNFAQILNDLQKGGFNLDRNEYIEQITSPTLLILDDFGIERNTEYALEQIYNVINARYLKARPTIITTNINFKDIEKEQEDIMLGRIYSRIIEMCLPLRVTGLDRRKIQSKEKLKKAQNLIDE